MTNKKLKLKRQKKDIKRSSQINSLNSKNSQLDTNLSKNEPQNVPTPQSNTNLDTNTIVNSIDPQIDNAQIDDIAKTNTEHPLNLPISNFQKDETSNNLQLGSKNSGTLQNSNEILPRHISPTQEALQEHSDIQALQNAGNSDTPTINNADYKHSTHLYLYSLIKSAKSPVIYKSNKQLKGSHEKNKFKLHGKLIYNDELFTACTSPEDCKRQIKIAESIADEAEERAKKQKSKRSKMWSLFFLILNIVIIVVAVIISASQEEGMVSIGGMFSVANFWYLLAALVAFICLMGFEGLRYYILIWRSTRHSRPFLSYKVAAIGRYYDNITPLSSGGQPMQIYYLKKRGIKASTASTMPFAVYVFNQLITLIISICVLIFSEKIAGGLSTAVFTAAVIGVIINTCMMLFVFVLSFSKKVGPVLTIWVLKLLYKMHIIKDYTAVFRKVMRFVSEYQKTFRYFVSNFKTSIMLIGSTLLVILTKFLIPAFVVCMFNKDGFTWEVYSAVFIWCVLIEAVLSYIPWPGAGGVAEVTYTTMFAYFSLSTGTTIWAMLIYRLFQYYFFLLQGLGVLCYDFFVGNKKIEKVNAHFKRIDEQRKLQKKN